MSNRLYVGNLAYHVTEDLLRQHLARSGDVRTIDLILDRASGRPRGFAFVEMATPDAMQKAITDLDGKDFEGRTLSVNVAEERRSRGGGDPRGGREGGWGRGR